MAERIVRYTRHEDRSPPKEVEAPLWGFLLDIPYLGVAGIFPPLHLLNEILRAGGKKGVSGASWQPFEISVEEYREAMPNVLVPPSTTLERYSRMPWQVFDVDLDLDHITDYDTWVKKALEKHGQAWGLRMALSQHQIVMNAHTKG